MAMSWITFGMSFSFCGQTLYSIVWATPPGVGDGTPGACSGAAAAPSAASGIGGGAGGVGPPGGIGAGVTSGGGGTIGVAQPLG